MSTTTIERKLSEIFRNERDKLKTRFALEFPKYNFDLIKEVPYKVKEEIFGVKKNKKKVFSITKLERKSSSSSDAEIFWEEESPKKRLIPIPIPHRNQIKKTIENPSNRKKFVKDPKGANKYQDSFTKNYLGKADSKSPPNPHPHPPLIDDRTIKTLLKEYFEENEFSQGLKTCFLESGNQDFDEQMRRVYPFAQSKVKRVLSKHLVKTKFLVPKNVETTFSSLASQMSKVSFKKLFRPRIYFDLQVSLGKRIKTGRLVFQLFTEACPVMVLQMVKACTENTVEDFAVKKICLDSWLKCTMMLPKALREDPCFYQNPKENFISHDNSCGILSFDANEFHETSAHLVVNLNISFFPLIVPANLGKVPIGTVTHGQWLLNDIHSLGVTSSISADTVRVTKCGRLDPL